MKERIVKLLGLGAAQQILMGTFHSTCAKLLRMYGSTIGLSKDFQIIDYEDSKVIMKNFLKESEEWHTYDPATILDEISNLKNNKMTAKQFQSSPKTVGTKSFKVHVTFSACKDRGTSILIVITAEKGRGRLLPLL